MGLHGQAAVTHNQTPTAQAAPAPQDLMLSPEQLQLVTDYFQKVRKPHRMHSCHMAAQVWSEFVHVIDSSEASRLQSHQSLRSCDCNKTTRLRLLGFTSASCQCCYHVAQVQSQCRHYGYKFLAASRSNSILQAVL